MRKCLAAWSGACALMLASPALAQDEVSPDEPDRPWSLSLGGGVSIVSQGEDPWSSSVDLTRSLGDASVSLGYSRTSENGQQGVPLSLASKSETISASVGYAIGSVSLDVHGSYGVSRFEVARLNRRTGRTLSLDGDGKMMSVGGSLSYGKGLDLHTSLSASVSLSWDRSDTARVLAGPLGNAIIRKERQSGITGNASVALSRTFGEGDQHVFGLNAGIVASDNAAASASSIRRRGAARALRPRPGFESNDTWNEFGASLGLGLTDQLSLDFWAMRTMGMKGPESNSLSSGLSFAF